MLTLGLLFLLLALILAILRFFIGDGRLTAGSVLCLILATALGAHLKL